MHDTTFVNQVEERFANLLNRAGFEWEYEVRFEIRSRHGSKYRTVDFVTSRLAYPNPVPVEIEKVIYGPIEGPVRHFEVKTRMMDSHGRRSSSAMKQKKDLLRGGINTLIVTEPMIEFWEENGFERKF